MKVAVLTVVAFLWALSALAQGVAKNPTAVIFTCPDHATDTGHEVDIVSASGTVMQTIAGGDPPADASGDVRITLNVQPIAFGEYFIRIRAIVGAMKSDDSTPSPIWQRVPGRPGGPRVE